MRLVAHFFAVLGLMLLLHRQYVVGKEPTAPSTSISAQIKQAILYIRQNPGKDLSLDEIAKHVGLSKFYLSREFKKQTGQTLTTHINIVRCREARRLIEEGMSISSAAIACGFENLSYFSRTYKLLMGRLPSKEKPH